MFYSSKLIYIWKQKFGLNWKEAFVLQVLIHTILRILIFFYSMFIKWEISWNQFFTVNIEVSTNQQLKVKRSFFENCLTNHTSKPIQDGLWPSGRERKKFFSCRKLIPGELYSTSPWTGFTSQLLPEFLMQMKQY